jgi:histidinol-phosphate aminotransferase
MNQLARQSIMDIKPYVPGKPIEEVARELGLTSTIIKLASNENPLGPSKLAIKSLKKQLGNLNLYPDDNCYHLSKAIAGKFKIKEDELILGNGSVEILEQVTQAFVNKGDEIIMAEDSFIMYKIVTAIAEGVRKAIPLKDYRHNLDAMADAVTEKTKAIFIANPNNPTGTMNSADEVKRFMAKIPENIIVVFDEAYREYILRDDFPDSLQYFRDGKNVIILRTFSKIYGLAGLRIGYGIANRGITEALRKVRLPFNVNSPAQIAGLAALNDENHVKRSIEINAQGKEFLYAKFKEIGLKYIPTEANFIYVMPAIDSAVFSQELMKSGIIVRHLPLQDTNNGVRITIGTKSQNKKLIKRIKDIFKKHGVK